MIFTLLKKTSRFPAARPRVRSIACGLLLGLILASPIRHACAQVSRHGSLEYGQGNVRPPAQAASYFGFDKDEYPGDNLLSTLYRHFAYTGYWLNRPPGASSNSWKGKRSLLKAHGFGFLILFNGRLDAELKGKDAAAIGRSDAAAAISAASEEGFPREAVIFLDQEEGGRLLPEQRAYLFAWTDEVSRSRYRPGVYCSGISVSDGSAHITTAQDILNHAAGKHIALWIFNDQCPPSPGCTLPRQTPRPAWGGIVQTLVWQYAQSPRSRFARQCGRGYAADGNCYVPFLSPSAQTFIDLDVSTSADPSAGR